VEGQLWLARTLTEKNSMTISASVIRLSVVATLTAATTLAARQPATHVRRPRPFAEAGACAPDTSKSLEHLQHAFRFLVAEDEEEAVAARQRWEIPVLDTMEVELIREDSVCAAARTAFRNQMPTAPVDAPVHVLRIRHLRVVDFPLEPETGVGSPAKHVYIFNADFSQVVDVLGL
jgi:hypothetical protein